MSVIECVIYCVFAIFRSQFNCINSCVWYVYFLIAYVLSIYSLYNFRNNSNSYGKSCVWCVSTQFMSGFGRKQMQRYGTLYRDYNEYKLYL